MTWIEKKKWFDTSGGRLKGPGGNGNGHKKQQVEMSYTISEVAQLMKVSRQTVWKWLSVADPDGAVIPLDGWFKTPGGDVRIRESALLSLQNQT